MICSNVSDFYSFLQHTQPTVWSSDRQLGNPIQWNTIHANSENILYPVKEHANKNFIQIRPTAKLQYRAQFITVAPLTATSPNSQYHSPKGTYVHSQRHFGSPIEEYLLHAQMPLPIAKTFIMTATAEPDYLT